jgi:hypothetical protein
MIVCWITPPASERCMNLVRDAASMGHIASFMPMPTAVSNLLEACRLTR